MLISSLEGTEPRTELEMWLITFGMLILPVIGTIFFSQHSAIMGRAGVQVRNAVSTKIYRKSLKMSSKAKGESSTGKIVNIMSNDAEQPTRFFAFANFIWGAPLRIGICIYLIHQQVGNAMWAGFGFLIILLPIQTFVFTSISKIRRQLLMESDKRVKLTNEVLSGIRVIKFYNWEKPFKKINEIRQRELKLLYRYAWIIAVGFSMVLLSAPLILPLIVFTVASKSGVTMTAAKAFTTVTLFALLRFPFAFLPMVFIQWIQTSVSFKRIYNFLLTDELSEEKIQEPGMDLVKNETPVIEVTNGTFKWDETIEMPTLSNINLKVFKGELIAVVGAVGSGKSSLLSAILNELAVVDDDENGTSATAGSSPDGVVKRNGSIAYVAQQPWILNKTLRDNIVFGTEFDQEHYDDTIANCALIEDLKAIKGGDKAEIGERGINISGGQKARIALARSVYLNRDVYLIDDPLSAVDAHVGAHIFENCIKDALKEKTIVLVTNALQYLPQCDRIIMINDGKIANVGTYDELLQQGIDFKVEIEEKSKQKLEEEKKKKKQKRRQRNKRHWKMQRMEVKKGGRKSRRGGRGGRRGGGRGGGRGGRRGGGRGGSNALIEEEERGGGDIKFARYTYYFQSMGIKAVKFWICLLIIRRAMEIVTPFILAEWSRWSVSTCKSQIQARNEQYVIDNSIGNETTTSSVNTQKYTFDDCRLKDEDNQFYINLYVLSGMIAVVFVTIQAVVLAVLRVKASKILHENMLVRILKAPTKFFDTTPLGRVLNRFSTDVSAIDNQLAASLSQLMSASFNILGAYVAICISTVGSAFLALVPITWMYHKISKYFRHSSTQLKRIESNSRSPIFSSFSETLNGAASIRAYGMVDNFINENDKRFTINGRNRLTAQFLGSWLGIRLDAMSSILSFLVAAYATATFGTSLAIPPGWAALALTLSFETTNFLKHGIRVYAQTEAAMVSVERIAKYSEDVEQENDQKDDPKHNEILKNNWPLHGKVEVKELSMRYRKNLPLVLNKITFTVEPGHHVGIVGRTGAGKSSIMNAFFRMIEAEEGSIIIDGIDTQTISLDTLRSRMTIIPQVCCLLYIIYIYIHTYCFTTNI